MRRPKLARRGVSRSTALCQATSYTVSKILFAAELEIDVTNFVEARIGKLPSQETPIPAKLRNTLVVCCGHQPTATKETLT